MKKYTYEENFWKNSLLEGRKVNHNNVSSEPHQKPRPWNIIVLMYLIRLDKTIFKELGHIRA